MGHETEAGLAAESLVPVGAADGYSLLNDLPVDQSTKDLLGTCSAAEGIAKMLRVSAEASPFVVAVDADWGMGKSTLLHLVRAKLEPAPAQGEHTEDRPFRTVWFNAWTAENGDALAGLIKSVLEELDPNIVRRALRNLTRRKRLMSITGIGLTVAARFFGANRLVDELWARLYLDDQSRNKLRGDIEDMLKEWADKGPEHAKRCMVVFIDDLDRCSDDVVVKVCEAVKLYLDVPGLIFVLACDQSVLARSVQDEARGGLDEARSYLEKIIQVQYRLSRPDDRAIELLIDGYAEASKTSDIIQGEVRKTLAEGCGGNPRKIKRIINSFILEYQLSPAWRNPSLGSYYLLIAILLQHLYAAFYDLLVQGLSEDPISEFLEYAELRTNLMKHGLQPRDTKSRPMEDHLRDSLAQYDVYPSEDDEKDRDRLISLLDAKQPGAIPALVDNQRFLAMLRSISEESRAPFLRKLRSHPLVTESPQQLSPMLPGPRPIPLVTKLCGFTENGVTCATPMAFPVRPNQMPGCPNNRSLTPHQFVW